MPVSTAPGTADGRDGGGGGTCARFLWAHAERSSAASATARAGVRNIWSDYGTVTPAVLPLVFVVALTEWAGRRGPARPAIIRCPSLSLRRLSRRVMTDSESADL